MIKNLETFLDIVDKTLKEKNISLKKHWFIDHICLRASSIEEYDSLCQEYSENHKLLIESPVGGRQISTFKLAKPILFKDYEIPLIEIPQPKAGRVTPSGYEHIEIVITESFDELIQELKGHNLLKHALSKEINPELEIEFESFSIKFHHQSLEEVIEYEKSLV